MPVGDFESGAARESRESREDFIKSMQRQKEAIRDLLSVREKELSSSKEGDAGYDALKDTVDNLRKSYVGLVKDTYSVVTIHEKEATTLRKTKEAYDRQIKVIKDVAEVTKKYASILKDGIAAYHAYNIATYNAVDATGKFAGEFVKGRQQFNEFRRELNLTRTEAEKFSDIFVTGMRLGASNDQLKQMVGNLQKLHGQMKGLELAKQVLQVPMGGATLQGVANRRPEDIAQAMRVAKTSEQLQGLAGQGKTAAGRPAEAQEAVRFERTQAKFAGAVDEIKAAVQTFGAVGVGPETAALLGPLSSIDTGIQKLIGIQEDMKFIMALKGATQIPGIGGALGNLFGGGGGPGGLLGKVGNLFGGGGVGGLMKGLPKAGLLAAGGYAAGAGLDYVANRMNPESNLTSGVRTVGGAARGAGYGAAIGSLFGPGGTVVGAISGGVIGGLAAAAGEWGKPFVDSVSGTMERWSDTVSGGLDRFVRGITGVKGGPEIGDILQSQATATKTLEERLTHLDATLKELPESLRMAIQMRGIEVGVRGPGQKAGIERVTPDFMESIDKGMDELFRQVGVDLAEVEKERKANIQKVKDRGGTPEEVARNIRLVDEEAERGRIKAQLTVQEKLKGQDRGALARAAMQGLDYRTAQRGTVMETAEARFKATGAVTGDRGSFKERQEAITRRYEEEEEDIKETIEIQNRKLQTQLNLLAGQKGREGISKKELDALEVESEDARNQLVENKKILALKLQNNKVNEMNAKLGHAGEEVTRYQLTNAYREGKYQEELAKAKEETARMMGTTPEALGAIGREGLVGTEAKFKKFSSTMKDNIDKWDDEAKKARKEKTPEGESRAVGLEQKSRDAKIQVINEERTLNSEKLRVATLEVQERQKQLGLQKRMIELDRDRLTMIGATWQEVMKNTVEGARVAQEELKVAQEELAIAREKERGGAVIMELETRLKEKQNAVVAATTGKQRDFMEKAIAAGFGMGGGTRALPNINKARIYGEQFINIGGQRVQGAGMPIEQQAAMRGAGMIPGLGPAAQLPGKAPPGPFRLQGDKGAKPGAAPPVDVSGKIEVVGKFIVDEAGRFVGKIEEITKTVLLSMISPGGPF